MPVGGEFQIKLHGIRSLLDCPVNGVHGVCHVRDIVEFFSCQLKENTIKIEPVHEISNNMVCATSKASDQPAHMRSLIRAFASRLNIL